MSEKLLEGTSHRADRIAGYCIKDLILAMDYLEELLSRADSAGWSLLEEARRRKVKIWVHTGILNALFERWLSRGMVSEFRVGADRLLFYAQPMAALAEDAIHLCRGSSDPYPGQVSLALNRLDGDAKALCLTLPGDVPSPQRWITADQFLKYLETAPPVPVPFVDLQSQQCEIREALERNIFRVLMHGKYVRGEEIHELEQKLAEYTDVKHCIACSSGTDAILLSLMTLGIGPGDAVFTTPFTFFATAEVVALLGATPVFVDVDPSSFLISPRELDRAIRSVKEGSPDYPLPKMKDLRARAIIAVDLFGVPCDYDEIKAVADAHGLYLIEDAAQALGASRNGRRACSFGDLACTSFFPAKTLGCYGDGGAVFTNSDEYAGIVRLLRDHGQSPGSYEHVKIGLNARMDTLQAAILLAKLEIFQKELELRRKMAEEYSRLLKDIPGVVIPRGVGSSSTESAWAQYCVIFQGKDSRDAVQKALRSRGIPSAVYYPIPLHLQPAFSYLGYKRGDFPVAEWLSERILALPFHPYMPLELMEEVAEVIESALRQIS